MTEGQNADLTIPEKADAAFDATIEHVLARARQTGTDIVLWRNNQVFKVSPDEYERELREADEANREPQ